MSFLAVGIGGIRRLGWLEILGELWDSRQSTRANLRKRNNLASRHGASSVVDCKSLHAFKINLLYDRALPLNMHNDAQFLKRLLLLADKVGKTAGQQLANSQK